jgi:hypothetical protein
MNALRTELTTKWKEAQLTPLSSREWRGMALSVSAAVRFIAGIREPDGRLALLIEAPLASAPTSIFRLQAYGLCASDQRRPDEGVFRLAITLEDDNLQNIFEVIAADVIALLIPIRSVKDAIASATQRLEAWQACLRARGQGLTNEEQLGLLGELTMLGLLSEVIGHSDAVEAWIGPLDGVQDFAFSGMAIEVKAALGGSSHLRISQFSQLDTTALSKLLIARPRFQEDPTGFTLPRVVSEMRNEVANNAPLYLPVLNERLLRAGYVDADEEAFGRRHFVRHEIYGYRVNCEFPRITPASVPPGIIDGTYVIDERSLANFRLDGRQFQEELNAVRDGFHE